MVLYIGTGAAPLRGIFLLAGLVLFWGLGFWQGKKRGFDALTLVLASRPDASFERILRPLFLPAGQSGL